MSDVVCYCTTMTVASIVVGIVCPMCVYHGNRNKKHARSAATTAVLRVKPDTPRVGLHTLGLALDVRGQNKECRNATEVRPQYDAGDIALFQRKRQNIIPITV